MPRWPLRKGNAQEAIVFERGFIGCRVFDLISRGFNTFDFPNVGEVSTTSGRGLPRASISQHNTYPRLLHELLHIGVDAGKLVFIYSQCKPISSLLFRFLSRGLDCTGATRQRVASSPRRQQRLPRAQVERAQVEHNCLTKTAAAAAAAAEGPHILAEGGLHTLRQVAYHHPHRPHRLHLPHRRRAARQVRARLYAEHTRDGQSQYLASRLEKDEYCSMDKAMKHI